MPSLCPDLIDVLLNKSLKLVSPVLRFLEVFLSLCLCPTGLILCVA